MLKSCRSLEQLDVTDCDAVRPSLLHASSTCAVTKHAPPEPAAADNEAGDAHGDADYTPVVELSRPRKFSLESGLFSSTRKMSVGAARKLSVGTIEPMRKMSIGALQAVRPR